MYKHLRTHGVSLFSDLRARPISSVLRTMSPLEATTMGSSCGEPSTMRMSGRNSLTVHNRRCTWNGLYHDDGFHIRICSHFQHVTDGCLLFLHEAVGIGGDDDAVRTELGLHLLGHAIFLFVLGYGTCEDANFPIRGSDTHTEKHNEHNGKHKYSLHFFNTSSFRTFEPGARVSKQLFAYYSVQKRIILLFV